MVRWSITLAGSGLMATAILGACSSDPDPAPATTTTQDGGTVTPATPQSEAGAANQAQACKTLPRDLKGVKPTDYFAVMTSDQAAVDLLTKRTGLKFMPPGSDFQKRGEALTAPIYEAFKKLYPETVEGMPGPPRIVIADDASFNAAAWGDMLRTTDGKRQAPWVFKFNKGAFVDGVTDSQLSLIAAHELGHLILRNPSPRFFTTTYYRETPDEQGKIFGEYEPNDPDLEKLGDAIVKLGARTGQLFATELNGFVTIVGASAYDGNALPLYMRYRSVLIGKYAATTTNPAACTSSNTSHDQIQKIIGTHFDRSTLKLELGAEAAQLDALTKAYQTQLAACFSHVKTSFLQLAYDYRVAVDPGAAEDLQPFLDDRTKVASYLGLLKLENDYDMANPTQNIVAKLFAISTQIQDAVQKGLETPGLKPEEIRTFTPEDDADEAAVRIAKLLGRDSDDLIIGLMSQVDPTYLPTCQALVTKGEVPAYGGFIDDHHTNCWRLYRNAALKRALASCPASWPK